MCRCEAEFLPVLRGCGPAHWRPVPGGRARRGRAPGARSRRCWAGSGAGGGAAAAVSLPGVPGGDRGRPARIAASAVVRSGASSTGSGAVRAGCDERCGKGGDESVASCRHVGEGEVDHAQSVDRVGACSPRPTVHSSLLPPRNVASASLTSSTSSWFSTTGGTPTLSTVSFRAHHGRGLRRAG